MPYRAIPCEMSMACCRYLARSVLVSACGFNAHRRKSVRMRTESNDYTCYSETGMVMVCAPADFGCCRRCDHPWDARGGTQTYLAYFRASLFFLILHGGRSCGHVLCMFCRSPCLGGWFCAGVTCRELVMARLALLHTASAKLCKDHKACEATLQG